MRKRRVLFVCHNHPAVRPGGAEAYALELYEAMRLSELYEPILLAKGGPPMSPAAGTVEGMLAAIGDDPNQYVLYTDGARFDRLFGVARDGAPVSEAFRRLLEVVRPDVVHFQHTLYLGYDLVSEARRALPRAPIVYTLHDYMPICHRWGQLLRRDGALCHAASPERCHECFPDVPAEDFEARRRFVQSHLSHVDLFLAPSSFLRDRFVEWGVPAQRIVVEEYGRLPLPPLVEPEAEGPRNRLGFFGQLTHFKGINVLLEAMTILRGRGVDARLRVHGANLDVAPRPVQNRFRELLETAGDAVVWVGEYDRASLPRLMGEVDWVVVPSLWWENSPLVIQEAFAYGRPVICSDVGGMAEKVEDGVNGLHFPVGDAAALAGTIERALAAPDLWTRLRRGVRPAYAMEEHLRVLTETYGELARLRAPGSPRADGKRREAMGASR